MSNIKHLTDDYYNHASNTTLTALLEDDTKGYGNDLIFGQTQTGGYDASALGSHYTAKIQYELSAPNVLSQLKSRRNESEKMTLPAQLSTSSAPNLLRLDTNFNDVLFSSTDFQMPNSAMESARGSSSASPTKTNSKRERPKSHTPRPSNSFILYRREKHFEIMAQYRGVKTLNNNVISKIVANMWKSETPEVKTHFANLADAEKRAHILKYPDYKYRPRKSVSKKVRKNSNDTPKNISSDQQQIMNYQEQGQFIESPMGQSQMGHVYGMEHPQMSYMMETPQSSHFQHMHMMDPRMSECGRPYDMMGNERFLLSPRYEDHGEFLQHETLLSPNDYTHAWPIGNSVNGVWDLCLDRKPFEEIPE
jgi:hypothetical protein